MPLYLPTFNDATSAASIAVELRKMAVTGVPKDQLSRGDVRDDVSDGAARLANRCLAILRDMGSAGLADWLLVSLSGDPYDLFACMVQRRFIEGLLAAQLIAPASQLDSTSLWVETAEHAPAEPVSAPKLGVPWAQQAPSSRTFTARVSLPTEH
jgi:hypothetical protein